MIFRRLFFQFPLCRNFSTTLTNQSQSLLATLRKKTGYSIANCKKALESNGNDLNQAEIWLNAQAQSQGWDKATKLQNRATLNGLVGITFNKNVALMVEVNCETDFVARNHKFQSLVGKIAGICLNNLPQYDNTQDIVKVNFASEQLGKIEMDNNSSSKGTLSDLMALNIGQIGENMSIRRASAICFPSAMKYKLACCTHPLDSVEEVFVGKYGAVVVYEETSSDGSEPKELPEGIDLEKLPKQLCQHIIGMNPQSIEQVEGSSAEEESALVHQEFVANPEFAVGEVLDLVSWKVKGYIRFECGES